MLILLACVGFVLGSFWLGPEEMEGATLVGMTIPGWLMFGFCVVFFGAAGIVAAIQFLPGVAFLRLSPSGFKYRTLRKRWEYGWDEVESFGTWEVPRAKTKMVGFNFSKPPEEIGDHVVRGANQSVSGFDAGLPDTYGRSADELAHLMNEWKERFDA